MLAKYENMCYYFFVGNSHLSGENAMITLDSIKPATRIFFRLKEDVTDSGGKIYHRDYNYSGVIVDVEPDQNRFWILCIDTMRMTSYPIDLNKQVCPVRIAMTTDHTNRLVSRSKYIELVSSQLANLNAQLSRWGKVSEVVNSMRS
jgi:hypothetical protein